MVYKHILVSVDLGPQSLYIGIRAFELAASFNAKLTCLHTIEPPLSYTLDFSKREKIIEKNRQLADKSLKALVEQLKAHQPKSASLCNTMISMGSPQAQILEAALRENCDLIMLGSHGIGGYTHLLGSTAHHILSHAHCDTLIVQVSQLEKFIKEQPSQHYLWENQPINIPQTEKGRFENTPQHGSKLGWGEDIRRGPRLLNRPSTSPYKGGQRRSETQDNEDNKKIDNDKEKDNE